MKRFLIILSLTLLVGMFTLVDSAYAQLEITNVTAEVDPLECEMTIEWDTNAKSSTKVYYGTDPGNLNYTATGDDCVLHHIVTFNVESFGNVYIYYKVESATNCETAQETGSKRRGYCIKEEP
ncbi:MAG: hypothetical protein JSV33_02205 [bacterium]|nr:MAG: hypothetical protein JSV33_02205 [bacterium]